MSDARRSLPSVSSLLESAGVRALLADAPRPLVLSAIRDVLTEARSAGSAPASWTDVIRTRLDTLERSSLRPVINGTGVVLHTNLGRAPLADVAIAAIARVASGYSNLEYDIERGVRGSRYAHCAALLCELTGAEDALVVNNGAAGLVLAMNTVCDGRQAIVSRGELVEIGGSFRIHDIVAKSGALVQEIGSTNRTHLADYERAISAGTGAILKVHRSNFAIEGFVADVSAADLASVARQHSIPLLHDLGSGLMISLESLGLHGEPTAPDALNAGADIVTMSGDKLLGGPQAGIILGPRALLGAMRSNPLARSFRVDKFTLAALEATLALYREPAEALRLIPVLAILGESPESVAQRANEVAQKLECDVHVTACSGSVGAGAYPLAKLESSAVVLHGHATRWASALRTGKVPMIGRIMNDAFYLDFRTIRPAEHDHVIASVNRAARSVLNA